MENNSDQGLNVNRVFNERIIKKGVAIFLSISIITLVAIFLYTNTGETLQVWRQLKPLYFLLALFLLFMDLFLGAWRNHIFVRKFHTGKSQWISFRANLANIFMGAVTPSQSGGGIAQFYVFYKNGITLPNAITISFMNWISTIVFFPISGLIAYQIIKENIPEGFISYLAKFGFSVFTTLMTVIIVALFFPQFIGKIIHQLAILIGKLNKKWSHKLDLWGSQASNGLIDYRDKCKTILTQNPFLMVWSFLLTILLYLNKYFIAYILILAIGIDADIAVVMAVQAIIYLLLYFAPSPGGSGIAELSIAGLMNGVISESYIGTFTLLQRSFLVFIPAIIGAFVVLRELNKAKEPTDKSAQGGTRTPTP